MRCLTVPGGIRDVGQRRAFSWLVLGYRIAIRMSLSRVRLMVVHSIIRLRLLSRLFVCAVVCSAFLCGLPGVVSWKRDAGVRDRSIDGGWNSLLFKFGLVWSLNDMFNAPAGCASSRNLADSLALLRMGTSGSRTPRHTGLQLSMRILGSFETQDGKNAGSDSSFA